MPIEAQTLLTKSEQFLGCNDFAAWLGYSDRRGTMDVSGSAQKCVALDTLLTNQKDLASKDEGFKRERCSESPPMDIRSATR